MSDVGGPRTAGDPSPAGPAGDGGQRFVDFEGARLCVETFGDPADPAILLVGGAAASMDWWEDGFCARLAEGGRLVMRYDLRDTGRSTGSPVGSPDYRAEDLVRDAAALLAHLGPHPVHVVGMSMGGAIAQRLAVDHPDRVATLTLMSTSPAGPGGPANPDLPAATEGLKARFADPAPDPDWSDRDAVIDHVLAAEEVFAGTAPVDEAHVRALAGRVFDRTRDVAASFTNHWILDDDQEPVRPRLGEITAPTLVVHGTEDPLFPLGHAEALTREIPGATLLPLPGVGHQMPPRRVWDVLVPAILRHTAGGAGGGGQA